MTDSSAPGTAPGVGTVGVRVKSALMFNGASVAAGVVLQVSPNDAADLLASARAVLVDLADLPRVLDAERKRTAKVMAAVHQGHGPHGYVTRNRM